MAGLEKFKLSSLFWEGDKNEEGFFVDSAWITLAIWFDLLPVVIILRTCLIPSFVERQ